MHGLEPMVVLSAVAQQSKTTDDGSLTKYRRDSRVLEACGKEEE